MTADAEKAEEDAARARRQAKERQRQQGRRIPQEADEPYEKTLVLAATKGIV